MEGGRDEIKGRGARADGGWRDEGRGVGEVRREQKQREWRGD